MNNKFTYHHPGKLVEVATQTFGRADHWNTESEKEHNDAYEAHMNYIESLRSYPCNWLTEKDNGRVLIEDVDFNIECQFPNSGCKCPPEKCLHIVAELIRPTTKQISTGFKIWSDENYSKRQKGYILKTDDLETGTYYTVEGLYDEYVTYKNNNNGTNNLPADR